MSIQDEIKDEVANIRRRGIMGPLRLVPTVNKRCFIPCGIGNCNCYPTVGLRFAIVVNGMAKSCFEEYLKGIDYLQDIVDRSDS